MHAVPDDSLDIPLDPPECALTSLLLSSPSAPDASIVLLLCYYHGMAARRKRSVSIPPDLDAQIEKAAADAGMTYSAWLAATARKEFVIRSGLDAVAEFERAHGAFTPEEIAEAEEWARSALNKSRRSGTRQRRGT